MPLGDIQLQDSSESEGSLLNLESFDPQLWLIVLDVWKDSILNSYLRGNFEHSVHVMFEYLELLTGAAKAIPTCFNFMKIAGLKYI